MNNLDMIMDFVVTLQDV